MAVQWQVPAAYERCFRAARGDERDVVQDAIVVWLAKGYPEKAFPTVFWWQRRAARSSAAAKRKSWAKWAPQQSTCSAPFLCRSEVEELAAEFGAIKKPRRSEAEQRALVEGHDRLVRSGATNDEITAWYRRHFPTCQPGSGSRQILLWRKKWGMGSNPHPTAAQAAERRRGQLTKESK